MEWAELWGTRGCWKHEVLRVVLWRFNPRCSPAKLNGLETDDDDDEDGDEYSFPKVRLKNTANRADIPAVPVYKQLRAACFDRAGPVELVNQSRLTGFEHFTSLLKQWWRRLRWDSAIWTTAIKANRKTQQERNDTQHHSNHLSQHTAHLRCRKRLAFTCNTKEIPPAWRLADGTAPPSSDSEVTGCVWCADVFSDVWSLSVVEVEVISSKWSVVDANLSETTSSWTASQISYLASSVRLQEARSDSTWTPFPWASGRVLQKSATSEHWFRKVGDNALR